MSVRSRQPRVRRLVAGLIVCLASGPSCDFLGLGPEPVGCETPYAAVRQAATDQLAEAGVSDAALLVRVDNHTVCRLFFGSYGPSTQVRTVSAAKWLTAGAMLALVDRGKLGLDTRTATFFPEAPPPATEITLAQLLSHTSGILWFSRCMGRPTFTLQACAEEILQQGDLLFQPGRGFFYEGPAFTVAGAMAEKATGQSWAEVFAQTIATPLGMTGTSYGESPNPALSEGDVVSTLDDYGRFAEMILNHGSHLGRRVLSEAAIQQMRHDWRAGTATISSPRGELPYGLGVWLDSVDGAGVGTVLSSPGAGGFVPLIDYDRHMVFVFETYDDIERVWPAVVAVLDTVRAVVDRGG